MDVQAVPREVRETPAGILLLLLLLLLLLFITIFLIIVITITIITGFVRLINPVDVTGLIYSCIYIYSLTTLSITRQMITSPLVLLNYL